MRCNNALPAVGTLRTQALSHAGDLFLKKFLALSTCISPSFTVTRRATRRSLLSGCAEIWLDLAFLARHWFRRSCCNWTVPISHMSLSPNASLLPLVVTYKSDERLSKAYCPIITSKSHGKLAACRPLRRQTCASGSSSASNTQKSRRPSVHRL